MKNLINTWFVPDIPFLLTLNNRKHMTDSRGDLEEGNQYGTEQAEIKAVDMGHSGKTGTWLSPGHSIITKVQELSLYPLWSLVL